MICRTPTCKGGYLSKCLFSLVTDSSGDGANREMLFARSHRDTQQRIRSEAEETWWQQWRAVLRGHNRVSLMLLSFPLWKLLHVSYVASRIRKHTRTHTFSPLAGVFFTYSTIKNLGSSWDECLEKKSLYFKSYREIERFHFAALVCTEITAVLS